MMSSSAKYVALSDEEYKAEVAARRAKQHRTSTAN